MEELEKGETHNPMWNAAQREMVKLGEMHGYMSENGLKKKFDVCKYIKKEAGVES